MSKRAMPEDDPREKEDMPKSKSARLEEEEEEKGSPSAMPRVSLDTIRGYLAAIKANTEAMASWTSLRVKNEALDTSKWLADLRCATSYRPPNNEQFTWFVRHVLAAHYRRAPTEITTRLNDKFLKRHAYDDCSEWESPIELLVCKIFFTDYHQADFLALATELAGTDEQSKNEILGICCWAIVARQMPKRPYPYTDNQRDLTRDAVSNLVALILTFRGGPPFTYCDSTYRFKLKAGDSDEKTKKNDIWMPDFARHWFGIEMPDFCEEPSRIQHFLDLLPAAAAQ